MRKIYFAVLLIGALSHAQTVNFPDPDFKAKLLMPNTPQVITIKNLAGQAVSIDMNGNGEIEFSEAQQIGELLIINDWAINDITGIEAFTNLKKLILGAIDIDSADFSALTQLWLLSITSSGMSSLALPPPSPILTDLSVDGNQLSSLDLTQYISLKSLDCSGNLLTTLDVSPLVNLENLNCSNNQISSLDVSPLVNLKYLYCSNNQISSLDVNAPGLKVIDCQLNQLQALDLSGFSQLGTISCQQNALTNLNLSGTHVVTLDCSNNLLSSLDLYGSISKLDCSHNQLTELDLTDLGSFTELNCSFNQLSTLVIPDYFLNLTKFNCSNNVLTELEVDRIGLSAVWEFDCSNNQLTHLDVSRITAQLNGLNCSNNNLLSLYVNFVTSFAMNFNGNPQIQFICAPESMIGLMQAKATTYGYTDCVVNSYCTFSPFGDFYTVNGNTRIDTNANGCGADDPVFPLMRYTISNGATNGTIIADQTGGYAIDIQAGTHNITPTFENPTFFTVTPSSVQVNFPGQDSPVLQDFCVSPNGNHPDLEVFILPLGDAIPGFDVAYKLMCRNKGNQVQAGTMTLNYDAPILDLLTSSLPPASEIQGSLQWNFADLQPFQMFEIALSFNLNSPTETPAVNGGDIIQFTASANAAASDETPLDNTFDLNQVAVNSFDPNDKTCLEGTTVGPAMVGQYIHYVIRFENLGTADARNIVIKDMIDTQKFDTPSLVTLNASHPVTTRILTDNKVEFIFENINLPFDDANNDGYVAFKIKTKPTLAIGDTFSNTASIYFDYNFPIVTNTATTTIQLLGNPDLEFSDAFVIYPNPTKDILNIQSRNGLEVQSAEIFNMLGQLIQIETGNVSNVDISRLQSGNYFLKVNSEKGNAVTKFIKR